MGTIEEIQEEIQKRIRRAVARGWCHPKNSNKMVDTDLASAISEEVEKIWRAEKVEMLEALECVQAWINRLFIMGPDAGRPPDKIVEAAIQKARSDIFSLVR